MNIESQHLDDAASDHGFTPPERRLIRRLSTPVAVQRYLNRLPYNTEPEGDTLRSFRQVVRKETAHCLEAALFAACMLEQHGYPPLLMGLESVDRLDHVIFVYKPPRPLGSVARSRDPGLHGRKPVFRSPRALAESYFDPYIDLTGMITRYSVVHMRVMGNLRLAVVAPKRLGGRADAVRGAAPEDQAALTQAACGGSARSIGPIWKSTRRSRCTIAAARSGRKFRSTFCKAMSESLQIKRPDGASRGSHGCALLETHRFAMLLGMRS